MATRAKIIVEGMKDICVYKHFDGYESATLPWLESFNKKFTKKRGDDPEYKFAQLLRSSAFDSDKFKLDESRETGWGVMKTDEVDTCYTYILKRDGTVEVKSRY